MAYEVIISSDVLKNLDAIVFYLEKNWSKKIAMNFLYTFYKKVDIIALNPAASKRSSRYPSIRTILITKHNRLYYEVFDDRIELLQLLDTRQNPEKNKFE
jgi:plasmid stabilization system protein ParE